MTRFNLELCQALLRQTNSIDETARLMNDHDYTHVGFRYWRREIIKHIENGDLII